MFVLVVGLDLIHWRGLLNKIRYMCRGFSCFPPGPMGGTANLQSLNAHPHRSMDNQANIEHISFSSFVCLSVQWSVYLTEVKCSW